MRTFLAELWSVLADSHRSFTWHLGALKAGAIAYFAALSLIPFTLVLVSLLGRAVGSQEAMNQVAEGVRQYLPGAGEQVVSALQQARPVSGRWLVDLLSGLALVWSSTSLFATLSQVLTVVWFDEPRPGYLRQKLVGVLAVAAAGIVFFLAITLTSVAATAAAQADRFPVIAALHNRLWFLDTALAWVVQGALAAGVCYLMYQTMPSGRVSPRAALAAAIPAGLLWNLSRSLFAVLVTTSSRYGQLYGPLAGAIALLVWIYLSAHIVIYCGEIGATLQARYWPPKTRR